ncbi:hypothetical protein ACXYMP_09550 [Aliiroseovarius sp. CAU 1755]
MTPQIVSGYGQDLTLLVPLRQETRQGPNGCEGNLGRSLFFGRRNPSGDSLRGASFPLPDSEAAAHFDAQRSEPPQLSKLAQQSAAKVETVAKKAICADNDAIICHF